MTLAGVFFSSGAGVQAAVFRGRLLISDESVRPAQVRVILDGLGASTPSTDGSFAIAIPSGTRTVTLRVESATGRLQVAYPQNPVNVPLDANAITDVFVGPTIEKLLADALGPVRARLESSSRAAGVEDSSIRAAIAELTRYVADAARVRADDLDAAAERAQKRAETFPEISESLERFDLRVNNVHQAFLYVAGASFSNDSAFALLKRTINEYNPAFDTLQVRRNTLENVVRQNWDEQRWTELRAVFDYALSDIHAATIKPMNSVVPRIDSVLRGRLRGDRANRTRAEVVSEVQQFVRALEPKLGILRERKVRILAELQS
jgi:hypothetical protein